MPSQSAALTLDLPYWFKQRQARTDENGPGAYKISGPNLPDAVIAVRMTDDLSWQAVLRETAEGPELAVSSPIPTAREAVQAAFELYRNHFVI